MCNRSRRGDIVFVLWTIALLALGPITLVVVPGEHVLEAFKAVVVFTIFVLAVTVFVLRRRYARYLEIKDRQSRYAERQR